MNKKVKIKFENFSFRYQALKYPTLKNINLEIYEGEKVLIAGRSGSGKSTIIHCLNGLIPSFLEGEISGKLIINAIGPYNRRNISEINKKVGTILQDQDVQFVGLSVGEDVAFIMENDAVPEEIMKGKVEKSLELVDLKDFISYSPYELSDGQKQRASIAGILTSKAEILVFDEPLANLDPQSGKNAVKLIDEINKTTGKTIIIVENRIEEILEFNPDRIIIIEDGKILAADTPSNILISGILEQAGLREPLYIEAIRNAQVDFSEILNAHKLESFATLNIREKFLKKVEHKILRFDHIGEIVLSVNRVSHNFIPGKKVLNNVSFDINKGEIISILGNDGAGKSVLSFLITGLIPCKEGKIILSGDDITNIPAAHRGRKIGLAMQNPNKMIVKNIVKDEVSLGLKAARLDTKSIEEKTEESLRICDLWGHRNWPISALSYGQKKRVTIASILALAPKVIILDEPTAGQDFKTYTQFMDFIKTLAKTGITTILITNDMQLALEYSTRSIVISNGVKIADDTPSNVFSRKEIITAACLRETSLHSLAESLNIDKQTFLNFFLEQIMPRRIKK